MKAVLKRRHRVTPQGIAKVEASDEEKRKGKLPNQGNQIILRDRGTRVKIHQTNGVCVCGPGKDGQRLL